MLENTVDLWRHKLPVPKPDGHKYNRGHAILLGARELTGATRLAAEACSRIGAGLVTVLADGNADIYRLTLAPDIMVSDKGLACQRVPRVLLAGCGGITQPQLDMVAQAAQSDVPMILDAAAIAPFIQRDINGNATQILTPHDKEFAEAFPSLKGSREERALLAVKQTGGLIVLKGARTIIAAPDHEPVVNTHASPYLAKAGTGDVLAGMVAGLITQGMPDFEAACAAVWMHGEAGKRLGPGLIASDIVGEISGILGSLLGAVRKNET